eukprot:Pgem_evm1s5624
MHTFEQSFTKNLTLILNSELNVKTPRNIPCPRCDKFYSSNNSLKNHLRLKHSTKRIKKAASTTSIQKRSLCPKVEHIPSITRPNVEHPPSITRSSSFDTSRTLNDNDYNNFAAEEVIRSNSFDTSRSRSSSIITSYNNSNNVNVINNSQNEFEVTGTSTFNITNHNSGKSSTTSPTLQYRSPSPPIYEYQYQQDNN